MVHLHHQRSRLSYALVGKKTARCSVTWILFVIPIVGVHLFIFIQHYGTMAKTLRSAELPVHSKPTGAVEVSPVSPEAQIVAEQGLSLPSGLTPAELLNSPMAFVEEKQLPNIDMVNTDQSRDAMAPTQPMSTTDGTKNVTEISRSHEPQERDDSQNSTSSKPEETSHNPQEEMPQTKHQLDSKYSQGIANDTDTTNSQESPISNFGEENELNSTLFEIEQFVAQPITGNSSDSGPAMYNNSVFNAPDEIPPQLLRNLDAVLVVGGGEPISNHAPSLPVQRSLDDVNSLVTDRKALVPAIDANLSIVCLSTGRPSSGGVEESQPVSQGSISASYLLKHEDGRIGVDPDHVYIEPSSLDMIGSAFYSRVNFANPNGWRNILVVVNQLRLEHAQAVFQWIYSLDSTKPEGDFNISFLAPPEIIVETPPFVNTEQSKVDYVVQQLAPRLRSMKDLFHFLSHEHELYTTKNAVKELDASKPQP